MNQQKYKIAIIGAGITGLTAALEMTSNGHSVDIFESSNFIGGQASTFDVGGHPLERGYHHLFTSDKEIIDLMRKLEIEDELIWPESSVGTYYQGKIFNFVTPLDLLKFTPISLINRLRLGITIIFLQRMKKFSRLEDVTAYHWLRKFCGKPSYEVFWKPMLRGKFGEKYYERISMAWIWGKIQTRVKSRNKSMIRERLGYPKSSFKIIFEKLKLKILEQGGTINLNTKVEEICVNSGKISGVITSNNSQTGKFIEYDAVLATTPSFIFKNLIPELPHNYVLKLDSVNYMSAVLLILILDRPLTNKYWLNIADRSIPFVAVIEHTNLVTADLYGGKHIVYLSNYLNTDDQMFKMEHEELLNAYLPHIKKINPNFQNNWIEKTFHHKVGAAQPIIETNYREKIVPHDTPIQGVYLANTSQIYPEDRGTNYGVKMGTSLAKMILRDLKTF